MLDEKYKAKINNRMLSIEENGMNYIKIYKIVRSITIISAVVWGVNVIPKMLVLMNMLEQFTQHKAYSVGIIGGADGPTSIYLTHNTYGIEISHVALILVMVGLMTMILLKCKIRRS